jgi:hypothetical protein
VFNVKGLITLVLLIIAYPAWSSQTETEYYRNVIAENITRIDSIETDVWQYQRRSKNAHDIRVEVYNPKHLPKWRLILVNDRYPSEQQLVEYTEKQKQLKNNNNNQMSLGDKLGNLVQFENSEIISQDEKLVHLTFSPKVTSLSESDQEKLSGFIILEKESGLLKQVVIYNINKLNPAFSVKIENFAITMDFTQINGHTHVEKITTNIRGKYAFFKAFQDHSEHSYSDFTYVGN